jgi:hypothetical protein
MQIFVYPMYLPRTHWNNIQYIMKTINWSAISVISLCLTYSLPSTTEIHCRAASKSGQNKSTTKAKQYTPGDTFIRRYQGKRCAFKEDTKFIVVNSSNYEDNQFMNNKAIANYRNKSDQLSINWFIEEVNKQMLHAKYLSFNIKYLTCY